MRVFALRPLLLAWPDPFPRIEPGEEVPDALQWPDLARRVELGDVELVEDEDAPQFELAVAGHHRESAEPATVPDSSSGPSPVRVRRTKKRGRK